MGESAGFGMTAAGSTVARGGARAGILVIGFATAVLMWWVGYLGRLPMWSAPAPLLFTLFVLCMVAGGVAAGRVAAPGWRAGAWAGLITALINLLVLGSLLPHEDASSALLIVEFLATGVIVGAVGGVIGGRWAPNEPRPRNWEGRFALIAAIATFLLLVVGGLVTSEGAGLAVPDWPTSFGNSMFLFPLSKMTGGIYYEHAHRLFGSLVGLTTVALAGYVLIADRRRWVGAFAIGLVALVAVQGYLGGIRVTDKSQHLALIHGITAQIFFALMVALAAFTSTAWHEAPRHGADVPAGRVRLDRRIAVLLFALLLGQLFLGALVRHYGTKWVGIHIGGGTIVFLIAIVLGARVLGRPREQRSLRRSALLLVHLVPLQVILGFVTLAVLGTTTSGTSTAAQQSTGRVLTATSHQALGALVLASGALLLVWTWRFPMPSGSSARRRGEESRPVEALHG